jgi:hypothetical protein
VTDPALSFRAVPGPAFAAGCTVSTWVHAGALAEPVAYVLIGHAPPRRVSETAESIEAGLMGMVDAMRLRPAAERVPIVGARLVTNGPLVALDYGHPRFVAEWLVVAGQDVAHVPAGPRGRVF